MTDRELLELAAKAAGIDTSSDIYDEDGLHIFYKPKPLVGNDRWYWNPLIDDGDALRLAVKFGLAIVVGNVNDYIAVQSDRLPEVIHSDKTDDPYAATRRAIVRAAAEIGKELP